MRGGGYAARTSYAVIRTVSSSRHCPISRSKRCFRSGEATNGRPWWAADQAAGEDRGAAERVAVVDGVQRARAVAEERGLVAVGQQGRHAAARDQQGQVADREPAVAPSRSWTFRSVVSGARVIAGRFLPGRLRCGGPQADGQQRQVGLDLVALGDEADDRVRGVGRVHEGHEPGELLGVVDGRRPTRRGSAATWSAIRDSSSSQMPRESSTTTSRTWSRPPGIRSSQVDVRSRRSAVRM